MWSHSNYQVRFQESVLPSRGMFQIPYNGMQLTTKLNKVGGDLIIAALEMVVATTVPGHGWLLWETEREGKEGIF